MIFSFVNKFQPLSGMTIKIIPIRTHILTPQDDIVDVVERYTRKLAEDSDIVAICESPLAIVQGRILKPTDLKPTFLARVLCRFINQDASLSSIYGMQAAMNECGTLRVLFAFMIGSMTKILGRKGDFYRLAGDQAKYIDDVTGNLPPYDKHIVLGPVNMDETAERVKERTGLETAIVDVNDLYGSEVIGSTKGIDRKEIAEFLIDNPQGNADEQTPILLIKGVSH